ncbi:MAG: hypothetical protein K1X72_01125 [Pyrinomonadaceae bacterium]|nr:hypothetical protein [Pyrinomonadaceae bacterium]
MKRIYLTLMLLGLLAIGAQAQTTAPASNPGSVMRVTFYEIKPGKGADYMKFRREHSKPILDEAKKQGVILDYKWLNQPTGEGPNSWDVALVVYFKTYSDALENAENGRKYNEIALKHYGSQEAKDKADAQSRELRDVVSSHLMREEILNPIQ